MGGGLASSSRKFNAGLISFLLNFVWKSLQMPLFAGIAKFQNLQTILH